MKERGDRRFRCFLSIVSWPEQPRILISLYRTWNNRVAFMRGHQTSRGVGRISTTLHDQKTQPRFLRPEWLKGHFPLLVASHEFRLFRGLWPSFRNNERFPRTCSPEYDESIRRLANVQVEYVLDFRFPWFSPSSYDALAKWRTGSSLTQRKHSSRKLIPIGIGDSDEKQRAFTKKSRIQRASFRS